MEKGENIEIRINRFIDKYAIIVLNFLFALFFILFYATDIPYYIRENYALFLAVLLTTIVVLGIRIAKMESLKKIILTKDGLLIEYVGSKEDKSYYITKENIKGFNFTIDVRPIGRSYFYNLTLSIHHFNGECIVIEHKTKNSGTIEKIFSIAKHIPNFRHKISFDYKFDNKTQAFNKAMLEKHLNDLVQRYSKL